MFPNMQRYMEVKYGPKKEEIEVTETEFIRLMMAAGKTEDEAKFQVDISRKMGASMLIGDKMVKISEQ